MHNEHRTSYIVRTYVMCRSKTVRNIITGKRMNRKDYDTTPSDLVRYGSALNIQTKNPYTL